MRTIKESLGDILILLILGIAFGAAVSYCTFLQSGL